MVYVACVLRITESSVKIFVPHPKWKLVSLIGNFLLKKKKKKTKMKSEILKFALFLQEAHQIDNQIC